FTDRVAQLFDLPLERAESLLESLDDAKSWQPGIGAGNELVFVPRGPRRVNAETGFVRLEPNISFPRHRHLGEETSPLLSGSVLEQPTGRIFRAGDELVLPAASEHAFSSLGEGCLFAVAVEEGVTFPELGITLSPKKEQG